MSRDSELIVFAVVGCFCIGAGVLAFPMLSKARGESKVQGRQDGPLQERISKLRSEAAEAEGHGNFDLAELKFKQAIMSNPSNPLLNIDLGCLYLKIDRERDAYNTLSQVFGRSGVSMYDIKLSARYGLLCIKFGASNEARKVFSDVVISSGSFFGSELTPELSDDLSDAQIEGLALACLAAQGDPAEITGLKSYQGAISDGESACRLAPTSGFAHFALGEALYRGGRYADSLVEFQKAIDFLPDKGRPKAELLVKAHGMFRLGHISMALIQNGKVSFQTKKIPLPNKIKQDKVVGSTGILAPISKLPIRP